MAKPKLRCRTWLILIGLAVLTAGAITRVNLTGSEGVASEGGEGAPVQGAIAPDFTLQSPLGETIRLSDLRGRPVLINFWATWCGPCQLEMPALQDRFERYEGAGFIVLGVNFDESARTVDEYRRTFGLTFPLLLDPGAEVQRLYRNRSYPSSYFLDREGTIQVQHLGVMTEEQLNANLAKIGVGP